jgi:signal peptidase I
VTLPLWLAGADQRRTAIRATLLIVIAYVTFGIILLPVRGVGPSMTPTIQEGDILFVSRLSYQLREPRRGDVVAVRIARRSAVYVKRLVAMPGDRISIEKGIVLIDGRPIVEPYVVYRSPWELQATTLGPDEYFVVGDNRGMPMDLHEFGTASRARLIGPSVLGPFGPY